MMRTRLFRSGIVAALVIAASPGSGRGHAQAPVITPAGDPSVRADTIYALAVDSAAHPGDAVVFLLDDGVVSIDAVGRGTRSYRQVVHVLRQQAVQTFAERRLRYSPDRQKLTLNWVRVMRPSGELISQGAAQMQESEVAAAITNPVYVNQKELRLSLGGVTANTIVDISYTIEELEPYLEGDFYSSWSVHSASSAPVLRSRYILDVPEGVQPRVTEQNLNFTVQTREANGRRTMTWATADVPRYRAEPFAPDTNSVRMHIVTSLPLTWGDVARWYDGLSHDRYTLAPDVLDRIREQTAGATTRLDTIRALHRWVAQDIRYVSVSLGLGGYQPRTPDQTVATGFGDCKDKATLFIAALRSLGMEAYPVVLNTSAAAVRPDHPSIRQFNHMIAAVRDDSGYTFTDLTAALTPYGELPAPQQGGFAVIVLQDGASEEVVLPAMPSAGRRIEYHIVATLAEDGQLAGYMDETNTGFGFEARRGMFAAPLDSTRKAAVMRALLGILPGATGDSIDAFDGRDLYAPVRYRIYFSGARGTAQTGGLHLFTFPFGVQPATNRIRALEAMGERTSSIIAEQILRPLPPTWQTIDMRVTLPDGWRARVPADVIVESDFGTYATEYSQRRRELRIVRTERSTVGIHPPGRLPDVIEFFRAISADEDNRTIVIERGGDE
ncbi:hypothetical protein BH23GEM9_BH23GEM9_09410 [soil metagenome]